MDIQEEREAFESWWEGFHNGRQIACDYIEKDNSYSVGYANAQWVAWQAKAQAVPEGFVLVKSSDRDREVLELIDQRDYMEDQAEQLKDKLQELYGVDFGEHSSCNLPFQNAIDFDDSDLVLVEKAKLMQIIGSVSMIEPITRGNPYMDSVQRELTAITDVVKTVIEAQKQKVTELKIEWASDCFNCGHHEAIIYSTASEAASKGWFHDGDKAKCCKCGHENTLFFVDPPYIHSTRTANVTAYRYEMTDDEHIALVEQLLHLKGKVILCGYNHEIYSSRLSEWSRFTKSTQASGNRGGVTREEVIWINPAAQQHDLFGAIA